MTAEKPEPPRQTYIRKAPSTPHAPSTPPEDKSWTESTGEFVGLTSDQFLDLVRKIAQKHLTTADGVV